MKKRQLSISSLYIALVFLLSTPIYAIPIFDNGDPDGDDGDEFTWWIQAEDFSVTYNTAITGVHFWAVEQDTFSLKGKPWNGSLEYFIYNSAGSKPGTIITQGNGLNINRELTRTISWGREYEYEFEFISPFEVEANKVYWLGLHLSDNFDTLYRIYWKTTVSDNAYGAYGVASFHGYEDWRDETNREHAFYLVPEPATLSFLAIGGILLRRKRKA
jgi:hypothetical protein